MHYRITAGYNFFLKHKIERLFLSAVWCRQMLAIKNPYHAFLVIFNRSIIPNALQACMEHVGESNWSTKTNEAG